MMSEQLISIPAEHSVNVFGRFDEYAKKIERALKVSIITRGSEVHVSGDEHSVSMAVGVLESLLKLSQSNGVVTEQNADYAIAMAMEERRNAVVELDKDIVCRTIAGKPIKPKTLGQQHYVNEIKDKMIVFGIGPAGTGKTYLAMAMAINAFKNNEVGRIILTRPAIEAGEKLGFLPGDLQSR